MQILFLILAGVLQGIAEFLPISSSGHLALFSCFFFDFGKITAAGILMHLGTLLSVCTVCGKDVKNLFDGALSFFGLRARRGGKFDKEKDRLENRALFRTVLIVSLPLAALGVADFVLGRTVGAGVTDLIDRFFASRPAVVGGTLFLNGALLLLCAALPEGSGSAEEFSFSAALAVGLLQSFAVLPGLSRSGAVIVGCRLMGADTRSSLRMALLTAIPAVGGALAVGLPDLFGGTAGVLPPAHAALAVAVSWVVGVAAILLLRKKKGLSLRPFAFYCMAVGALSVAAAFLARQGR